MGDRKKCAIVKSMFSVDRQKGFSQIVVVALVVVIAVVGGAVLLRGKSSFPANINQDQDRGHQQPFDNQYQQNQNQQQDNSYQGYGFKRPFYSKDGISLQHYWPGDASFSNEETEILLLNESSSNVEVTSFDLVYTVEGRTYPHKSGTWEKFPSLQSWDKIEYLNISPRYYKGEQLLLTPGQKGKLHWHIQFDPNLLDGKQTVMINLALMRDNKSMQIQETLSRPSGIVFSKEERH